MWLFIILFSLCFVLSVTLGTEEKARNTLTDVIDSCPELFDVWFQFLQKTGTFFVAGAEEGVLKTNTVSASHPCLVLMHHKMHMVYQ